MIKNSKSDKIHDLEWKGASNLVVVKKQKGESDDRLIARFRKKVLMSKLLIDYKEKSRYRKESEKRSERKKRIKYMIEMEKQRNF